MNIFAILRGFLQLIILLGQISPVMVKLWRQWEAEKGKRLTADDRKRMQDAVKRAVETKDTTDLESFLTGKSE